MSLIDRYAKKMSITDRLPGMQGQGGRIAFILGSAALEPREHLFHGR